MPLLIAAVVLVQLPFHLERWQLQNTDGYCFMELFTNARSCYLAHQSLTPSLQNPLSSQRHSHHTVHATALQVSSDLVIAQIRALAFLPDLIPLLAHFSLKQLLGGHLPRSPQLWPPSPASLGTGILSSRYSF